MRNLRFAARQMTKRPGLAAVIVLMLAVGIGVNTAMFSLFHQMLLEPLPVPAPDRLVAFSSPGPKSGSVSCTDMGDCDQVFSYPMLRDLEREQTVFTGIAAHRGFGASIAPPGKQAVTGEGVAVNGSYFGVLGLSPAIGRLIGPQDEPAPGEGSVAVLSHDYWQNVFGGDPGVLGQVLTVNGVPLEIIGVAPEGFRGASVGARPQVFVPLTLRWRMEPYFPEGADNRQQYWAYLFARLKPGVSVEQAEDAISGPYRAILNDVEAPLSTGMSEQGLERFRARTIELEPGARGQSQAPDTARLPLTLLLGVTALVLAIACVNIANMLLARGAMRTGEMALRSALGASRRRMVLQLVTEAGLLGLIGCAIGLPVGLATLEIIVAIMPPQAAGNIDTGLSGAALLFAVAASLVTILVFGLFPAFAATRTAAGAVLKEQGGQQQGGSRSMARFRRLLVTVQIAFSMVLLVLAGLFTQSLANVARIDLGLEADAVATFSISPVLSGYSPERSTALFRRVEDDLAALPGVSAVASSMVGVVAGNTWGGNVSVQGFEALPDTDTNAQYNMVSPGFFRTLQIPLLSGRDFSDQDAAGRPKVAIVNRAFAEKFGLDDDAVGKRMAIGAGGELDIEIVGLVEDAKYSDVKAEVPPQFFIPWYQDESLGFMNFYVRGTLPPAALLASMSNVVTNLDPDVPVDDLSTLPEVIRNNTFLDRLISMLSAGFAMIATLLAATGLYGVLSYSVAQRTRELGVRQALGATPFRLRAMVLRQVGRMGVIGGLVGLACAVAFGRVAESVLFGLVGYDLRVLAGATAVLGLVVIAAGYLPARHASRVDPLSALRYE